VFEYRALRKMFGPKKDEVTVEWRKLHNEELHKLYSSPDIIRQGMWHAFQRRQKCTSFWWESPKEIDYSEDQGVDGIRMDLGKTGLVGVDWIRLAQDTDRWRAVVSALMNLRVLAPHRHCVTILMR
jgi:hypothetical protein